MNADGKSDRPVVPEKSRNKAEGSATEAMEGRDRTKGNLLEGNTLRTQGRDGVHSALERVRQVAREDKKQRFTALLHHVYDIERLRSAYLAIKRDAAAGVDGETWQHFGENLEGNLQDLSLRLKRTSCGCSVGTRISPYDFSRYPLVSRKAKLADSSCSRSSP
jgi:RNA-directed DNA polymerase